MNELIKEIQSIIADYHCDSPTGFSMTTKHIQEWVKQFEEKDRCFILSEFSFILKKDIYITKVKAKELLINNIEVLSRKLKYTTVKEFLNNAVFVNLQPSGKSQDVLLNLLDIELQNKYGVSLAQCGIFSQKNFIYVDDILASGKTILRYCRNWFAIDDNLKKCLNGSVTFSIITFCSHLWGENRVRWSLKHNFQTDYFTNATKLLIYSNYIIHDNTKELNPILNFAYPLKLEPNWDTYLASLTHATEHEGRAYRDILKPREEVFFSSQNNRSRFEQILMNKGIEIINKIQDDEKRKNHRPLGKTYPHYKTFGTGSLFFTWRNISNTCPLVFWWENPKHNWKGLFPLNNRGT